MADNDPTTPDEFECKVRAEFNYTRYPCAVDLAQPGPTPDQSKGLPVSTDLVTPVKAEVTNRLRESILATQYELGLKPSGTYGTVRARLDAMESLIAELFRRVEEGGGTGAGTIHVKDEGSTVLANAKILNFIGDAVTVTNSTSVQADVTITNGLVMIQIQESTTASIGQFAFTLSTLPDDDTAVFMFINGIKQDYGSDYTVSGKNLTYSGAALAGGEVVEFWYLAVGSTVQQQQESFSASAGQVHFLLSQTPQDDSAVQMYVNGIKQEHGADYVAVASGVTYSGASLSAGDVVEFWYIVNISGGTSTLGIEVDDNGFPVVGSTETINFVGPEWIIGSSGASTATVALSKDGYSRVQETLTVTSDAQTAFTLTSTPLDNTAVELFIEGIKQEYTTDYTVSGTALTYNHADILIGDIVEVVYQTDSYYGKLLYTKVQETLAVLSDAQTNFTLANAPSDDTKVEFFIEGVKQEYGTDYTVSGTTVTYNDTDILIGDVVEAVYWRGSSATTYEPVLETLPSTYDGQTTFSLNKVPDDVTGVEFFIAGIKQEYGTDYSVSNSIITYNDTDIVVGDVVDAVYISGDGTKPTWAQVLAWGNVSGGTDPVVSNGDTLYGETNLVLDTLKPDGYVVVNGKLTVTGLIDPTGLVLDQQSSVPGGNPTNTKGTIWIRESDGYLVFTNRDGITISLQSVEGNESLAETLLIGNVTGGKDIVFSSGDDITTPDAVGASTPLYIRTGDSSTSNSGEMGLITGVAAAGGNTGTVWMQSRDHTGVSGGSSGAAYIHSGSAYVNSGAAYVYSGNAETGVSGNAYVKVGNGYTGTGEARLTGGDIVPSGSGTVAATYVTSGNNYGTGDAGYLRVQSGLAINGDGGNLDILAGAGSNDGGYLNVVAGYSTAGRGGSVTVGAGYGYTTGGDISVAAGDSGLEPGGTWTGSAGDSSNDDGGRLRLAGGSSSADGYNGGNIELYSGNGGTGGNDGYIIFYRGSNEVARWDNGGSERLLLGTQVVELAGSGGAWSYITTPKNIFDNGLEISTGESNIAVPTGNIRIASGDVLALLGGSASGDMWFVSGNTESGRSGNITIGSGVSAGNTSGNVSLTSADGYTTVGSITIETGDITYEGNLGGIRIAVGNNPSTGSVGEINILGGTSEAKAGGDINIFAGDGYTASGEVIIKSGSCVGGYGAGNAHNVEIYGGHGSGTGVAGKIMAIAGNAEVNEGGHLTLHAGNSTGDLSLGGGPASLSAGNSTTGFGGNLTIAAGGGALYDGYIIIERGVTEVARWNEYNQLDVNAHRIVDVADPVDPQDAATKSYVDNDGYEERVYGTVVSSDDGGDSITVYTPGTNAVVFLDGIVVARGQTSGDSAAWKISAVFEDTSGTVSQIGSASIQVEEREDAAWTADVSTDGTDITIDVVGDAFEDVSWRFVGKVVEGP